MLICLKGLKFTPETKTKKYAERDNTLAAELFIIEHQNIFICTDRLILNYTTKTLSSKKCASLNGSVELQVTLHI